MSFEDAIVGFQGKFTARSELAYRESVALMCEAIIDDTPIDTGALLGNWGMPTFDKNKTDKYGDGTKIRIRAELEGLPLNISYYFTNPAPYAYMAEFTGWKFTPPYAMVRNNTQKWTQFVERAFNELSR